MDLSIRGHSLLEDGSPINVPTGENGAGITCDGEQKWLSMRVRDANAINIRQKSVTGEMHRGILADFKTVTGPRSSRIAFCFSFRHFGRPSRKLVKGQLRLTHNLKISEKE